MMLDPVPGVLIIASFVVLFASAAAHKLRDLKRFDAVFCAYELLPLAGRMQVSWLVPVLEAAVAIGLLWSGSRPFAGCTGMALLLLYAGAMALNLRRGRRDIACGCGGPDDRQSIAAWMAWRNLVLALLLGIGLWPWRGRALLTTDRLTIGFGLASAIVIYLCLDRLGTLARQARLLKGLQ
jgi:hypothetical protein